jgi:hypothetical protein
MFNPAYTPPNAARSTSPKGIINNDAKNIPAKFNIPKIPMIIISMDVKSPNATSGVMYRR